MKVCDIVGEPLVVHGLAHDPRAYKERVADPTRAVGLLPDMADRYTPLAGRGRPALFALEPSLIVCDEPVSALDAYQSRRK